MYPILRFADVMIRGRGRSVLGPDDASELRMTVSPWDCDMFIEMNNGRHLTLFDLGRFDFGIRCGLMRVLKQKKWGLVVAGSSIRYRKRLTPFQRYTLRTRLIARDDRWYYFVQTTWRNGEACSSGAGSDRRDERRARDPHTGRRRDARYARLAAAAPRVGIGMGRRRCAAPLASGRLAPIFTHYG